MKKSTFTLRIPAMMADGCIASVTRIISRLDKDAAVEFCLSAKTVEVDTGATPEQVVAELDNIGWEATKIEAAKSGSKKASSKKSGDEPAGS